MKIVDCLVGSLDAPHLRRTFGAGVCVTLLTMAALWPGQSRAGEPEDHYVLMLEVRGKASEPSPVALNEPVEVRIEVQPLHPGSGIGPFEGTFDISTSEEVRGLPDHFTFTADDDGVASFRDVRFTVLGRQDVTVRSDDPRLITRQRRQRVVVSLRGPTVLVANLQEAFDERDVGDHSDVRHFAPAVARSLDGEVLDVVLLQEVRRSSARYIAGQLTKRLEGRFHLATPLPRVPWSASGGMRRQADTAILANTRTVKVGQRHGFLRTPIPWGPKTGRSEKLHAYRAFTYRKLDAKFVALSVHLPRNGWRHQSKYMDSYLRWTGRMKRSLRDRFPKRDLVMGGDFNISKDPMPFYSGINCVVCVQDLDKLYTSWLPWRLGEVDGSFSDHDAFWARVLRPAKA